MGNENKVSKDLIVRKTEEFFKDALVDSSSADRLYSLTEEYARTRQSRQFFLYLSVILFIGALVLTTMLLTMRIRHSTRQIAIDIADFKSVNLSELLTTSRRNETRLKGLEQEIADLKSQRDSELAALRDRYEARRRLLTTMGLSPETRLQRERALTLEERQQAARITREYDAKIEPKMKEAGEVRQQIASSGQKLQKTQTAIDNFQQLWQIEEKKLLRDYNIKLRAMEQNHRRQMEDYRQFHEKFVAALILKYNPLFESEELKRILADTGAASLPRVSSWEPLLQQERALTRGAYDTLKDRVDQDFLLIRRLRQVAYTNSVAPALQRIEHLTGLVVSIYDNLWSNLVKIIAAKNRLLEQHRGALSFHAAQTREHGFVVNADDADRVLVVMNRDYPVTPGLPAIVIRGDRLKVADISLYRDRDGVRAKVITTLSNARIQPLDKILIKYQ